MGSLRNPVGPLPSPIYWRRRAVAATLLALLALAVVWVVSSGGGGGKKGGDTSDGANPATSITPGPSGSGPAISEQPGGRDESGGSGEDNAGTGDDDGKNGDPADTGGAGGAGSGGTDGAGPGGTDGESAGGGAADGGAASGGGSSTSGRQVPVGSGLPNCVPGFLTLRLDTTKVAYEPGEKPAFRVIATNTSSTACKADFGPKAVVLTVTDTDDDQVWSSKDCPKTDALLLEVPAGGTITRTVQWDRKQSAPQCAKAPTRAVGPGTYLVEAKAPGATVRQGQKSIRLEED
ncbi:hypothetical protein [Streptomyces sp. AK02-01A]|uniref:hypothetical protein n=1 Tax=Streptomyces sp. AK02-01A TaxID=3028648 RepID=UPI0029AFADD9|nr:hypothetical protein [Streptomyces sp. AK02-01A]MDX3850885.1 hypothetical protein [Streptomyces sp. AK02-01A]